MASRAALESHLALAAMRLNDDELRVLTYIAERIGKGQRGYGAMNLADDPRDFRQEAAEEAMDGLVYLAMDAVRAMQRGGV